MSIDFLPAIPTVEELKRKFLGSVFYRPRTRHMSFEHVGYFIVLDIKYYYSDYKFDVLLINKNKRHTFTFTCQDMDLLNETNTIWWDHTKNGEIWATKVS